MYKKKDYQIQMFPAMGITFSSIFNQLFGKKDMRILMVGLDAAGMTGMSYHHLIIWWSYDRDDLFNEYTMLREN